MARHRADGRTIHDRPSSEGRRSVRSGLDALPLWTGLLLTAADAVNRSWFTAVAWLAVALRAALVVHLFRLQDRSYRGHEGPSGTTAGGADGGGDRNAGPTTDA